MTPEQIEAMRSVMLQVPQLSYLHPEVNALCDMALKAANPDMVLVPREPTEAMVRGAFNRADYLAMSKSTTAKQHIEENYTSIYHAMIATAMKSLHADDTKEPKA